MSGPTTPCVACNKATPLGVNTVIHFGQLGDLCAPCSSRDGLAHLFDNRGVAFDAVGCSCGWSAKATNSGAKWAAFLAHRDGVA